MQLKKVTNKQQNYSPNLPETAFPQLHEIASVLLLAAAPSEAHSTHKIQNKEIKLSKKYISKIAHSVPQNRSDLQTINF